MTTMSWLAVLFVGGGLALLSMGVLARVYQREHELAKILDLPWGEQDVDVRDVAERHSQLVENTIGVAGKVIESIDAKGALLSKLEKARVPVRPGEYVILVTAAGIVGGALIGVITSSVVIGAVALVVSPFLGRTYLNVRINRRRKKFESEFPEALTLIASSLTAGHTFLRAIQMMTMESEGPLAEEFGRVVSETELGDPLIDALQRMSERLDIRDVDWVVQAIKIQQNVGGKLADLLHTLADFIRAREEVRREIDVLTAEGRVSAFVLGLLPMFLLVAIQVMQPGYMDPMFQGWGWIWLGGAALICIGSVSIILRMVKSVEV